MIDKVNDYEGIYVTLARAIANREAEFVYSFGIKPEYTRVTDIAHHIQRMGYGVKHVTYKSEAGLRVSLEGVQE